VLSEDLRSRAVRVAQRASREELVSGLNEALELKRADLDNSVRVANLEEVIDVMLDEILLRDELLLWDEYAGFSGDLTPYPTETPDCFD
jgi:hypothetical protein